MKKSNYFLFGMILAILFFCLFMIPKSLGKNQYQVICLGDSIFGETRDESSIVSILSEKTGKKILNGGIGGTCAGLLNQEGRNDYKNDDLSLVRISQAIRMNDFSVVKSEIASNQTIFDYFQEVVQQLVTTNFKVTDVIFIEHGVNDYMAGIPIENPNDGFDLYTYKGALRYAAQTFREICPNTTLIFCTPTYMIYTDKMGVKSTCEEIDFGGGYLYEYVEAMKEVAEEYDIPVLDNYYLSGIDKTNCLDLTNDGLHPTAKARELLADKMADFLDQLSKSK